MNSIKNITNYRLFGAFLLSFSCVLIAFSKTHTSVSNDLRTGSPSDEFIIIAHRGASGYLPEHTKEALVLAYMQGADYIEQDLVLSKDDQLVVLHDIYLEAVTNVEDIFPSRARADKHFYAIDFTLKELRQLSLHERENAQGERVYKTRYQGNSHFAISTFEEHVELIRELNRQFNKNVGWYPEIKSPEWHLQEGKDITKVFAKELIRLELNEPNTAIFVQSFNSQSLKDLRFAYKIKVPLIQLIGENDWNISSSDYTKMQTQQGLQEIAKYAVGISPWLPQVIDSETFHIQALLKHAQSLNLLVHPYTHREESVSQAKERFVILKQAGINGIFTDQIMPYMHE